MNQPLLPLDPAIQTARGQLPSDGHVSWWSLIEDYEQGRLKIPEHQREPGLWGKRKRYEFVFRLRDTVTGQQERPLGVIAMYLLQTGDPSFYLNDGWQRLHTLIGLKHSPEEYGRTDAEMATILKHPKTQVAVQYRTYASHKEAAKDFQCINNGTGLRPAEKNKGSLVYSSKWRGFGEFIIRDWTQQIRDNLASFCSQQKDNRGEARRVTIYFFVLSHKKEPFHWTSRDDLETEAGKWLEQTDRSECDRCLARISAIMATIDKCWRSLHPDPGRVMIAALARWITFVRLAHDADCTEEWFANFVTKLLIKTGGTQNFSWVSEEGASGQATLSKRISWFGTVCKELGLDMPKRFEREKPKMPAKSGYHMHHPKPHVDHGEGDTIPLPALENAARNARTG